jgi:hypothetical protein
MTTLTSTDPFISTGAKGLVLSAPSTCRHHYAPPLLLHTLCSKPDRSSGAH